MRNSFYIFQQLTRQSKINKQIIRKKKKKERRTTWRKKKAIVKANGAVENFKYTIYIYINKIKNKKKEIKLQSTNI